MVSTMNSMTFREAHEQLRLAQKTNRGAPAYSRWVNRPAGRAMAAAAYRMGLTPNQVTAVSVTLTYSAIGLVAAVPPSAMASVVVAALLLVGYALDAADGQLARLTASGRPSGEWLDHVADMGKVCLINSAIAVSWTLWGPPTGIPDLWVVLLPALFLTVGVLSFFGWLLSDLLIRVSRAQRGIATAHRTADRSPAPVMRSLLRLPSDYGLFALTFTWFATPFFVVSYTALLVANTAILLAALPTWFRQVRTSEDAP